MAHKTLYLLLDATALRELSDLATPGSLRAVADSILRKEHGRPRGPERLRILPK
jgi:hypothetical protein